MPSAVTRTVVATLVVAAAGVAALLLVPCPSCRSMFDRFSFTVFLRNDVTEFAPTYTEEAFDRVSPGMSKADVLELLGAPLQEQKLTPRAGYDEVWRYSRSSNGIGNFWFRIVVFKEGRVVETEGKYFVN